MRLPIKAHVLKLEVLFTVISLICKGYALRIVRLT